MGSQKDIFPFQDTLLLSRQYRPSVQTDRQTVYRLLSDRGVVSVRNIPEMENIKQRDVVEEKVIDSDILPSRVLLGKVRASLILPSKIHPGMMGRGRYPDRMKNSGDIFSETGSMLINQERRKKDELTEVLSRKRFTDEDTVNKLI